MLVGAGRLETGVRVGAGCLVGDIIGVLVAGVAVTQTLER